MKIALFIVIAFNAIIAVADLIIIARAHYPRYVKHHASNDIISVVLKITTVIVGLYYI
jgi:hypothetical protein